MLKLSPEQIYALKKSTDLRDVVIRSLPTLKAINEELVGSCPFHQDDTPSFRVSASRYHCFGCHKHGDVFEWLKETQHVNFPQALELLTQGNGIEAINPVPREPTAHQSQYDAAMALAIIEANEYALDFYRHGQGDQQAKDYIVERFHPDSIETFDVGYAPEDSREFVDYMVKEGNYDEEFLIKASLLTKSSTGYAYGRLRDRVVFPLKNRTGLPLGFCGRLIPRGQDKSIPKYIHPSNTHAFKRNSYLYGWQTLSDANLAYVVEGIVDVISLHAIGVRNVFSILGSSIGIGQVNILAHLKKPLRLMLDGDLPGLEAVQTVGSMLARTGLDCTARLLSNDLDPDTIVADGMAHEYIKNCPLINLSDLGLNQIVVSDVKPEYDRTVLDELAKPYVEDNVKHGWPHYNVVDWVKQAYPKYANEITLATKAMIEDYEELPNGKRGLKPERVKEFLKAWMKPSRDVRKQHGYNKL